MSTARWTPARAEAGARLRRRNASTVNALTPQELQVALAAATGKTNREVGAALFISPKTVEVHLARVYQKLSIHTRAELIRRHAEHPTSLQAK